MNGARSGTRPAAGAPAAGPGPTDQLDADSRIMPGAGGGFEQAYNTQAAVATGSLLVLAADVVRAANDKEQTALALARLGRLPEILNRTGTLLADSGYFSEANLEACAAAKVAPLLAPGREDTSKNPREMALAC